MISESNILLRQRAVPSVTTVKAWIAMEPNRVFSRYPKIYDGMVKPLMELDPDYELLMALFLKDFTLKQARCKKHDVMEMFASHVEKSASKYPVLLLAEQHPGQSDLILERLMRWTYDDCKNELIYPFFHLSGKCFLGFARHWDTVMRKIGCTSCRDW